MPARPKKHRDMGCEYHYSESDYSGIPAPCPSQSLLFFGLASFWPIILEIFC